ncbi:MAG TPA: PAS domain-containing protein, partial [Polyangiaceae bacterium]|nr:PAS domain-containing protein [Polyangiaceae bacterium]
MSDSPPPSSVAELQAIVLREAVSLTDFSGHIHALLERSPSAIFAKRREDWRYIYANAAFEEFTSRLRDEMLGRTDEELFAVVSASKLRYDDAEIAETGEPTRREIVIRLNDSEERTFSVVKFPLRDRAGHIFAVCAILTDLTEQKRAVGALQDSEARWRTLFENTHQHISTIDSAGTILTVNRGLLGLSPSELVGMRCIDLVVGSGRDTLKKAISGVFVAPEVFVTEQEMRAPNGTSTWFEITLGPILRHGRVAEAILIASDITERRLIEERLRHSQKMEAVGRLAGGVAHDFNNLLTVISGHLQLHLRDITRGTASSENVQAALDAAYRASELTKQLLTFSRKSVVKPVLVD